MAQDVVDPIQPCTLLLKLGQQLRAIPAKLLLADRIFLCLPLLVDQQQLTDDVVGQALLRLADGGHGFGEFFHIHSAATDSKGNMYIGEVAGGHRVIRWNYKGLSSAPAGAVTSAAR